MKTAKDVGVINRCYK